MNWKVVNTESGVVYSTHDTFIAALAAAYELRAPLAESGAWKIKTVDFSSSWVWVQDEEMWKWL